MTTATATAPLRKYAVYLPAETWRALRQIALDRGEPRGASELVREAVNVWLFAQEVPHAPSVVEELTDKFFS